MARLLAILLLGLLLFTASAHAATISGTTYDGLTLEVATNTVISITTQPTQTKLLPDGEYTFDVEQGNYTLRATYSENGIVLLEAMQDVNVTGDGNYTIDLILLPDLGDVPDEPLPDDNPPTIWEQLWQGPLPLLGILAIILVFVGVGVYSVQRKTRKEIPTHAHGEKETPTKKNEEPQLDKYAIEIMGHLKRGGNRLTQKDLRAMVGIGEAKVSLVVSELESYEFVKKIKRGRGNILILTQKGNEYLDKEDGIISSAREKETPATSETDEPLSPESPEDEPPRP